MSKVLMLNDDEPFAFILYCPACKTHHGFNVPQWGFNGDFEKPTIDGSLLVGANDKEIPRCHSFVRDGKILYLDDCDHDFRGKTIELPDLDFE